MAALPDLPTIDVLVPVAPKDEDALDLCISSVLAHCRNPIRTIHVISGSPPTSSSFGDIRWINEETLAPSNAEIDEMLKMIGPHQGNSSWYFQQLAKLQCFDLLGDDAPQHVLVIDADFAVVEDMLFVDADRRAYLAMGYPLQWEIGTAKPAMPRQHSALDAAARLVPGWRPVDSYSGMQHHMVFDRRILENLIRRVEEAHGKPFWQAFLMTLEAAKWTGASEYVLYRHFACRFFPERTCMRHVSAVDVIQSRSSGGFSLPQVVSAPRTAGFQAVGCHRFLNYAGRLATMDYIPEHLRKKITPKLEPLKLALVDGKLFIRPALRPLTLP